MANNPIHLTILRRGDVHIVDLAEVQAIIPRSETRVDGGFLAEISEEIKRITNQVGPEYRKAAEKLDPDARRNPHVVRELKNLGSLIFSHLLPQAARDKLRGAEGCDLYLRLDDQLVHLPWELAFDGQDFLGMKFRVGRQVITHHKISPSAPPRTGATTVKVLIISDPSETLKNVPHESEQLCDILDAVSGLEVRLIGGRGVKRIPLLAALRESDIVHFAGHSHFDEKNPEKSGWLLYDGLLSASEISKLDQTPLLVFSNSCQAGATAHWQNDYLYEGEAFGLGSAFLLAGVANYIGTFCVVHDEESRFLAVEFYKRIAQGNSFGQALLEARLTSAEKMGIDRLTWASYMLYGDPACTLSLVPKAHIEKVPDHIEARFPDARPGTALPTPEEPKPCRFKWPRMSLKVWMSLTVGMLAVLVFGHLLTTDPSRRVLTDTAPDGSLTDKIPLSPLEKPNAVEVQTGKSERILRTPTAEERLSPDERNINPQELEEELRSTFKNAADAQKTFFWESNRYTTRIEDLILRGFRPSARLELSVTYADKARFSLKAKAVGSSIPFWTYDSRTGQISPGS